MPSRLPADHGSVTAEFAVALPAVIGVLALCLCAVSAVSTHVTLTSLAVDAARGWARGQSWGDVEALVGAVRPEALVRGTDEGNQRCVGLSTPLQLGSWIRLGIDIEETACAPIEP